MSLRGSVLKGGGANYGQVPLACGCDNVHVAMVHPPSAATQNNAYREPIIMHTLEAIFNVRGGLSSMLNVDTGSSPARAAKLKGVSTPRDSCVP